ncbi:MAG: hypothetical protein OSJ70_05045 [Bacilli bacterium]|nr:hypothetical protein [Bacilli bacterium]
MYKELTKKEIKKFISKYLNPCDDYTKKINHISVIEYNSVKEYLINHKYILKIYK